MSNFGSGSRSGSGSGSGSHSNDPHMKPPSWDPNTPPDAKPDWTVTDKDTPIMIDVLHNDMDMDGDDLMIKWVSNGQNGTVEIVSNMLVYTPDDGFKGEDYFVYKIKDGKGGFDYAKVHVCVIHADTDPHPDPSHGGGMRMGTVDFTGDDVDESNFLDILPDGVIVTAENIDDMDEDFTSEEVGFIDRGSEFHKGIGASSQTISPGSHVDTQTGFNPTDENGEVVGDAEDLKIEFDDTEFPHGIDSITLNITRLFPNEGTGDDNESFQWTIFKDGQEVGTGSYEAGTAAGDPNAEQGSANHAVNYTIDPGVKFDEVVLTALRYNNDASDNGGTLHDSSDFLLAGFKYVVNGNNAPNAKSDGAMTMEDTMIIIPVKADDVNPDNIIPILNNDSDPDGDNFYLHSFEQPDHGTVEQLVDGRLKYTPDDDYNGPDAFEYTIVDEHGKEDSAWVFIKVKPDPNDPPEIKIDCVRNMVVEVMDDMSPNPNPEGNLIIDSEAWDPDGDDLHLKIDGMVLSGNDMKIIDGQYGTLKVYADGTYEYDLNDDHPDVNALNPNQHLTDTFEFSVVDRPNFPDDGEMSNVAELKIKIKGTNDSPEVKQEVTLMVTDVMDDMGPSLQDGTKTQGNLLEESMSMDPDNGDTEYLEVHSVDGQVLGGGMTEIQIVHPQHGIIGFLSISPDGQYMLIANADNDAVNELPDGGYYEVEIPFTIKDPGGKKAEGWLTITIKGTNDSPDINNFMIMVEDVMDEMDANEGDGTKTSGNLLDEFHGEASDPDLGDSLTVMSVAGTDILGDDQLVRIVDPMHGAVGIMMVSENGDYMLIANAQNDAVNALAEGDSIEVFVGVVIKDAGGKEAIARMLVKIKGTNDSPHVENRLIEVEITEQMDDMDTNDNGEFDPTDDLMGNLLTESEAWDPDEGDILYVKIDGVIITQQTEFVGDYGTLIVQANGDYKYVLDNEAPEVHGLPEGEMLMDAFEFYANDRDVGGKMSEKAVLWITINGNNDSPEIKEVCVEKMATDEMNAEGDLILESDAWDPDAGDVLYLKFDGNVITSETEIVGTYGTLTVYSDGTYIYDVDEDNPDVMDLVIGEALEETFTFSVVDRELFPREGKMSNEAELKITIKGTNTAPEIRMEVFCLQEAMTASNGEEMPGSFVEDFDLNDLVTDPDAGDTHTFMINGMNLTDIGNGGTVVSDDGFAAIEIVDADAGIIDVRLTAAGEDEYNHLSEGGMSLVIEDQWNIKVTDGSGATAETTLKYQAKGNNDRPEIQKGIMVMVTDVMDDMDPILRDGTKVSGNLLDESMTTDPDDGDSVIVMMVAGTSINGPDQPVRIVDGPNGAIAIMMASPNGDYMLIANADNPLVNALNENEFFETAVAFVVKDEGGKEAVGRLTVKVKGTNDSPTAESFMTMVEDVMDEMEPDEAMSTKTTGNIFDEANASDPDNGDSLIVMMVAGTSILGDDQFVRIRADDGAGDTIGIMFVSRESGEYMLIANADNPDVHALAEGDSIETTVPVVIKDAGGKEVTVDMRVVIKGTNDSPHMDNRLIEVEITEVMDEMDLSVNDGTTPIMGNLIIDSESWDPDTDDELYVKIKVNGELIIVNQDLIDLDGNIFQGKYGTLIVELDGKYTYELDNDNPAVHGLKGPVGDEPAEMLMEFFEIYVNDRPEGGKMSEKGLLWITINGNNDSPTATANMYMGGEMADQGLFLSGNILMDDTGNGADSDPDGDTLFVTEIKEDGLEVTGPDSIFIETEVLLDTLATGGIYQLRITTKTPDEQTTFGEADLFIAPDGSWVLALVSGDPFGELDDMETLNINFGYVIHDREDGAEDTDAKMDMAPVEIIIKGEDEPNRPPEDPDEMKEFTEDELVEGQECINFKLEGAMDPDGDDIDIQSLNFASVTAVVGGNNASFFFDPIINGFNIELYFDKGMGNELVATFAVDPETGTETFNSDDDEFWEAMGNGDFVKVTVGYTVTDQNGGTDDSAQMVTINGVNDDPEDPDEMKEFSENELIEASAQNGILCEDFKLTGATDPEGDDLDIESLDSGSVTAIIGGSDASGDFNLSIVGFVGTLEYQGESVATFTVDPETGSETILSTDDDFWNSLGNGDFVKVSMDYTVTDGKGGSDSSNQMITINGVNDNPEDPNEMKEFTESELIEASALDGLICEGFKLEGATDPEGDDLDIQSLNGGSVLAMIGGMDASGNFSLDILGFVGTLMYQGESVATFTVNPVDGSENIFSTDDDFWEDLNNGDFIKVSMDYTVTDGNGGTDESTQMITINGEGEPNQPPVAVDDMGMTQEGVPVSIDVLDNDSDPDGDDLMVNTFDPMSLFGGTITDPDSMDEFLTYTPVDGFVGFDLFQYTNKDIPDGLSSNTANVVVMVSKTYDLINIAGNGTNNVHYQGKDGLLDSGTGELVDPPEFAAGKDPEAINITNGKDPELISPTGLGLASGNDMLDTTTHISSLDFGSKWEIDGGKYKFNVFNNPQGFGAGMGVLMVVPLMSNTHILVDFTEEDGTQANFVVTLGTDGDDKAAGTGDLTGDFGPIAPLNQDLMYGFLGDDEIDGGLADDVIYGDEKCSKGTPGDDDIDGSGGDDLIYGDNQILEAGFTGGNDFIEGGEGNDTIWGDARFRGMSSGGEDEIHGGEGRDLIYGDGALLTEFATAASDLIFGDGGIDDIYADAWKMIGATGASDTVHGGADRDFIYGDAKFMEMGSVGADDTLNGDGGSDLVYGDGEQVTGGSLGGDDIINGGEGADQLYGDGGGEFQDGIVLMSAGLVDSRGGDDELNGGAGNDFLFGDAEIIKDEAGEGLDGLGGNDILQGGFGDDRLWGEAKLVQDGAEADITSIYAGGDDTFLYDFAQMDLDLGDDEIFDYDNTLEMDVLEIKQLLDEGGGVVADDGELAAVSAASADPDGVVFTFEDNATTITLVGTAYVGGMDEITDYVDVNYS